MKTSGYSEAARALWDKIKKNRYVLFVIIVGLVLILWQGGGSSDTKASETKTYTPDFSLAEQEEKIADALSRIDGAGKTTVVLTLKTGTEQIVAENEKTASKGDGAAGEKETEKTTVVVSRGSSQQEPVTLKYIYPEYRGALIVAEGGDRADVKLQITRAVTALTGLGSDKVTVTKMK